ncbi:MAG: polysaccharide biosynthesis tyrosine autokinase [Pseudomonadota bacterium]
MTENKRFPEFSVQPVIAAPRAGEDDEPSEIDLRALLAKLWRGKWIIAITTLLAASIGYLTATQIDPVYRASSKVMFDLDESTIVDVGQIVGSGVTTEALQNQIEVLRSNTLVEKVVANLGLEQNPAFNPSLRPAEPGLREQLTDVLMPQGLRTRLENLGVLTPPPPPGPEPTQAEKAAKERRVVVDRVLNNLELVPVPNSQVIEIAYLSGNPNTSSRIANAFAETYIVDQLDAKLEATRAATDWLSGRVEELRDRVQTAEEAVESARALQSEEAGQSLEITQQQLQALNATLSVARNGARTAEATYERLRDAVNDGTNFGSVPEFRSSTLLAEYRARETQLLDDRAGIVRRVGEGHSSLERVDFNLELLRENMEEEALRIVEAARAGWASEQEDVAQIERDVRALEDLALEQARDRVTVRQLEREAEASRILYQNFLARLNETSEQERLTSADARILTPAQPPLSPELQQRERLMILSTLLGLFAGIGLVFLLDKLNNTFRVAQQVEQITGETVLGMIPAIGRRLRRTTVLKRFKDKPKSSLAEAVRSLRTSILFSNVDTPPKVILFTSSVPREGKSTTATLVALTSRQMGKSAIIVDCDLRLPALADLLKANDGGPGLLSAIDGTASLEDAIHRDPETGLDVLMTKPSEPRSSVSAADILSSNRFNALIECLKASYDLVILDTPPTLVVADARILSSHADAVVYAIRWDHTPRGAALEGLREMKKINAPLAGVVLTMVNESKAARYAYDGYSFYRSRYKDYYVS